MPSFVELGMLDSARVVANMLFEMAKTSKDPDDEMIAHEMLGRIAMKEKNYDQALDHLLQRFFPYYPFWLTIFFFAFCLKGWFPYQSSSYRTELLRPIRWNVCVMVEDKKL